MIWLQLIEYDCLKKYLLCTLSRSHLVQTHHYYLLWYFGVTEQTQEISLCGKVSYTLHCDILWYISKSLSWLSNIMLNFLSKNPLDISLLFKLKYAAILLLSYTFIFFCISSYRDKPQPWRLLIFSKFSGLKVA